MPKRSAKKSPPGIKLGSLVKDRITGFQGIAIGRTEFGYGCVHIRVQAKGLGDDGAPIPVQTFDDQRIEMLEPPTKAFPELTRPAIKLGDLVRDTLTEETGIATALTVELDGKVKVVIERPGLTEGGEPKAPILSNAIWVELVDKRKLKVSDTSVATSGGPMARGSLTLGGQG